MRNVYLDYSATTPVKEEVLQEMIPYFTEKFGNPSSLYDKGLESKDAVSTAREQVAADTLLALSNRQIQVLTDIANVLGRSEDKMTVTKLIGLLDSEPATQSRLRVAKEKLCSQAEQVNSLNQQNAALLNQALELTEFDITLFKSMRQAPETANYNKSAYNTGTLLGSSLFDAKQ